MEHYEFISRTDNKSLHNQIKYLVTCAQDAYQTDLTARREYLKDLLDSEEKIYENEFVDKIKSRVDENIRERQESLLAMKPERAKQVEKYVASKKLHQNMQNCIEIREELRKKDYRDTQRCQLEQMDEKLRAVEREKEDDQFWLKVEKRIMDDVDRKQQHELALKRALQANQSSILDKQIAERRLMRETDFESVGTSLRKAMKPDKLAQGQNIRSDLNTICEQRKLLEQEAETFERVFHQETMRQVRREMDEAVHKNKGLKETVLDYLTYVNKFKRFVADQDRKRDEVCDKLGRRFVCFKNQSKTGTAQKKRQKAESAHEVLLKQICEEQVRRAQLEAYQKENKIIENRFARLEVRDKLLEREKIKKDLDMQLEEIARLKDQKQKQFAEEMSRASEDQIFCKQLLQRHKADGCDYLPPHPNWKLLACHENGEGDSK